ncbi:G-PROTEIN-RECEP-F1-2 domain-containing protein [Aphelenchoides fujianensis]|nr:G-PROTEIN-RECEP-F1-2 domain-containing protein [Aphelenchoides fujianensis]
MESAVSVGPNGSLLNDPMDSMEKAAVRLGRFDVPGLLSMICVFGIASNLLLFCKRTRGTNRQASTTRIGIRLLCYVGIRDPRVMAFICKADLFLIHASSAFSIWCWLIMSGVRYIAIYRPYTHLTLNREPMLAVAVVAVMSIFFELWIVYDVTYIEEVRGCAETLPAPWGLRLQIAEIAWSYFLPLVLITILDLRVLCCHAVWKRGPLVIADCDVQNGSVQRQLRPNMSSEPICSEMKQPLYAKNSLALSTQSVSVDRPPVSPSMSFSECANGGDSPPNHVAVSPMPLSNGNSISLRSRSSARGTSGRQKNTRRAQQMRILKRFLAISMLDLSLNLPNYVLRLYLNVADEESINQINPHVLSMLQDLSQLFYFAQFALNSLYYVISQPSKSKKPKTSSYAPSTSKTVA